MRLPTHVLECVQALEAASFPTYAVGGCVRDYLLGLEPQDFDLCTAATPEQTQAVFTHRQLVLAGVKHGTVGVVFPQGVVEITTFRTEGGYTDGRHPDWVQFVPNIEDDLARRDFTVNAMAWSPSRGLCDPFGGQTDLKNHILRAVGHAPTRFQEDSLRILRGVRFSVKYNLEPEPNTLAAMQALAGLMDGLARERVFEEMTKLLLLVNAEDLIRFAPILTQPIPELAPAIGFNQHSPHHAYDLFTHTAHVTAGVAPEPVMRWAALLHDAGKLTTFTQDATGRGHFYGHAKESARIADGVLLRLKAPTTLREQAVLLIEQHMSRLLPERKLLRRRLSQLGQPTVEQLLQLQGADMNSKGTGHEDEQAQFAQIRPILTQIYEENACLSLKDLAINGSDLLALGFAPGKDLGQCLQYLLEQVVDETLPNQPEALLAEANKRLP